MDKRILYLGLDPSRYPHDGEIVHIPIIKIQPRPFDGIIGESFAKLGEYPYILVTSRTAATLFKDYALLAGFSETKLMKKIYLSLGKATAHRLIELGFTVSHIAEIEMAEGVVAMIDRLLMRDPLFFPHSAQGRTLIHHHLLHKKIPFLSVPLYDTLLNPVTLPPVDTFDEIIFTSPSTVAAYLQLQKHLPPLKKCRPIGPQTAEALNHLVRK